MFEPTFGYHQQRTAQVKPPHSDKFRRPLNDLGTTRVPFVVASETHFGPGFRSSVAQGHGFEEIVDFAVVILVRALGVD